MTAYITDIAKSVKAGADDTALNLVIQDYLDTEYRGILTTVAQWRVEKYKLLRSWVHPALGDVSDAEFKVRNNVSGGVAELAALDALKIANKLRFPEV